MGYIHILARIAQLVAWNCEPPPLGPSWNSLPYFEVVANMHLKQMWGRSVTSMQNKLHFLQYSVECNQCR